MKKYFIPVSILILFSLTTYSQVTLTIDTTRINMVCNGNPCFYNGPKILINEVMMTPSMYDGSMYGNGPGTNQDPAHGSCWGEWIELYNPDQCKPVDISCYFLGNNTNDNSSVSPYPVLYNLGGGFTLPQGTIVPARGFALIRGEYAPPVPSSLLVANGGNTVEIVVDSNLINNICIGAYRLWFPNAGGWFAFYDNNGVPQDAISWADQTNYVVGGSPCNPVSSGCSYTGTLPSYDNIPASKKTYITPLDPSLYAGQSWRRIPDGGAWSSSAATPTYGTCNAACIPPPVITCNGMAVVTASGGAPPYSYIWDDTQATMNDTVTGLCAGIYHVTATDDFSNTATASVQIYNAELSPNIDSTNVNCFGGNNGSASVTVTGGTPLYTYSWSNSGTTSTITNLSAGNYTVTITDNYGCDTVVSTLVHQPPIINISHNIDSVVCFGESNGSIALTVSGGTPDYTYNWNNGGTTSTIDNISSGNYIVTITDSHGCDTVVSATVHQPLQLNSNSSVTPACFGQSNGSIAVTTSGGIPGYSYVWNTIPVQLTSTASNLPVGLYTVTVTDANGCTASISDSVYQSSQLTSTSNVTPALCYGQNNGSITVTVSGGTPVYSYHWNTTPVQTTPTATNLPAGTYSVTITDTYGCTNFLSAVVTEPSQLNIAVTNVDSVMCYGQSNGNITVNPTGGFAPYTYLWNTVPPQTSATASNIPAGTWTVTVTDNNGCSNTFSANVSQPPQLISNSTVTPASCFGQSNGSISVTTSGGTPGYSYHWNTTPVQTTSTATDLPAGNYTVTITDNSGCTNSLSAVVTQPVQFNIAVTNVDSVICFGESNGSITVNPLGGFPPYTYLWNTDPPQTSATASDIPAGTWIVTVTDDHGCTNTFSATVLQPLQLTSVVTNADSILECYGQNDGTITIAVVGGTPPFSYIWNTTPPQTTMTIMDLTAGTYTITITDHNGCTNIHSVPITQPQDLFVQIDSHDEECLNSCDGEITSAVTGGTPFYTGSSPYYNYLWSTGATTSSIAGLYTGIYNLEVTDSNGCHKSLSTTIGTNNIVTASFTASPTTGYVPLEVNFTYTGSSSPTNIYSWVFGDGGLSSMEDPTHTYTVQDTFKVMLIVTDGVCLDTFYLFVYPETPSTLIVPNVFTPNSDGYNDEFSVKYNNIKTFDCVIYNRWGLKMYEWNDVSKGWDGKTDGGKEASDGVYFYILSAKGIDDVKYDMHGSVTLIRYPSN